MKSFKYLIGLAVLCSANASIAQTNRTALIIGVGEYGYAGAPPLEGVQHDMVSAKKIANAMGIADKNIKYIKNADATKQNIIKALNELGESTNEGARAFVYFSGHGTRQQEGDGCVEGLLTFEGGTITNQEFAKATQKLAKNADKVVTMIDACHAEGVVPPKGQTRALSAGNFTPKFFLKSGGAANACSVVANVKTRALLPEVTRLGGLQENFVQITSSRPDEQSLDQPGRGGLATQAVRDCLLGSARDLNGSGAVSMSEVEQCAQVSINQALNGNPLYSPHHVTVSGNRNLIPVQRPPVIVEPPKPQIVQVTPQPGNIPVAPTVITTPPVQVAVNTQVVTPPAVNPTPVTPPPTPVVPVPALPPQVVTPPYVPPVAVAPPVAPIKVPPVEPALASLATLKEIEQQRNPKRVVDVKVSKLSMKIGKDNLDLSIKSSHDGYVYLVLLGSDSKSFYVLYPNGLDSNNAIKAGQTVRIPKPDWEVKAAGPVGTNNLLVMVSDSPRKLNTLEMAEPTATNPFTYALNDIGGRSSLINFLTSSGSDGKSESFGAKLVAIKEVK